jgi:glycosyltransferase involved in cell wall biosynthesis
VKYASPDQLSRAIITILQDDNMAKRMGSAGRQRVLRDFTWQAVANRIESIYNELIPS